jgi:hypothetical protein
MSAVLSEDVLKYYFTDDAPITRPAAWFVGLHTAAPGRTGAAEVTGGVDSAYARKAVAMAVTDAEADGIYEAKNTADVVMNAAAVGASYTVTHISIWTAATGGTLLGTLALAVPLPTVAGAINSFAIGDIILQGI